MKLLELGDRRGSVAANVLSEFCNRGGGQAGQLNTDVLVSAVDTLEPWKSKPVEDDDSSGNSSFR